jgi:hypothetical protein
VATNVAIDGAWTLQLTNTMLAGRQQLAGLLIPGASGDPTTIRSGVLTRTTLSGVTQDFLVKSRTDVGSLKVDVLPGNAIINRTGQGPYELFNFSTRTPVLSASSSSNPRIDRIVLHAYDVTGLADTNPNSAGVNAAYVEVVTGTPAASPVAPTVPTNCLSLAQVLVPTNAANSSQLTVTDERVSTSLAGMARAMLPGDSATMTVPAAYGDGERRWVLGTGGTDAREDAWVGGRWQPQFLSSGRGYARYYRSAALNGIFNATEFKQQLDASSDTCPEITAAAGGGYPTNTDFTFNLAGEWFVSSTMRFVNPGGLSGSGMYLEARIAAASGSSTNVWDLNSTNVPANAGASMTNRTWAHVKAAVGDTISVYYKQGTGVSLNLDVGAPSYNRIEFRYVGP